MTITCASNEGVVSSNAAPDNAASNNAASENVVLKTAVSENAVFGKVPSNAAVSKNNAAVSKNVDSNDDISSVVDSNGRGSQTEKSNEIQTTDVEKLRFILKRDGRRTAFSIDKIVQAMRKAFEASGRTQSAEYLKTLADRVVAKIVESRVFEPEVEEIQDRVEAVLMEAGHVLTAKKYMLYRAERTKVREMNTRLMKIYEDVTFKDAKESDVKRENANVDGDTAMGVMLKYGSEGAKQFCKIHVLKPEHAQAHDDGDIHIHDLDFYALTTTCCQIDLIKLFKKGFCTGHGILREPNDIQSYSALACIAIQSNQNDQHGGQSIPNFDYGMAPGVIRTFQRLYRQNLTKALQLLLDSHSDETRKIVASFDGLNAADSKNADSNNAGSVAVDSAAASFGSRFDEFATDASNADDENDCCDSGCDSDFGRESRSTETSDVERLRALIDSSCRDLLGEGFSLKLEEYEKFCGEQRRRLTERGIDEETLQKAQKFAVAESLRETDRATYQAMEALIHNLNTMHSRAGAQTPFSTINYGMDTSPEGRMVVRNVLLAHEAGLGRGETPIFPIHVFRVKEGINADPGDPNYDLFQLACRVSAKRLFPNFAFQDAPYNLRYYRPGRPETEISYMGCRTRVIGNVYDPQNEISYSRGNLSFTSINLPRIAIRANKNVLWFFEELERKLDLCIEQLLDRFKIQCSKKRRNFPFLTGQGIWLDSDKLGDDDELGDVLKHGTLSVGFIGLAEALKALTGFHHGEKEASQNLGLDIISLMRRRLDEASQKMKLNFTLLATPAEGLSGRFVRKDRERFGVLEGITDRDYYTNSFHIPVYYPVSIYEKIRLEAPYHALTNAGHITYIELDGDVTQNLEAFENVVRAMRKAGIGYGAINHPIDRDPVCGFNGVIQDVCPKCGREEGDVPFERIRRITGYLVGTLDRFNDAKRSEVDDRLVHDAESRVKWLH